MIHNLSDKYWRRQYRWKGTAKNFKERKEKSLRSSKINDFDKKIDIIHMRCLHAGHVFIR